MKYKKQKKEKKPQVVEIHIYIHQRLPFQICSPLGGGTGLSGGTIGYNNMDKYK